ncbi:hypothetical protein K439DRAFT_1412070 [Ramaria rubella]|nr:hypothetical protein K439DRAFT_1412070 [Ramaria rubella]
MAPVPSSSEAKWNIAGKFGLPRGFPESMNDIKLKRARTPACCLPPSFYQSILQRAWTILDVYREPLDQKREAARLRTLDVFIVPLIGLFHGRIIDTSENKMPPTKLSTGGRIEHKIILVGQALFLVVELKIEIQSSCYSQLFLEMLSAAELNKEYQLGNLQVYGLLTDLTCFRFFAYDPATKKFLLDERLNISSAKRLEWCTDMIQVSNKIFSILLYSYINILQLEMCKEIKPGDDDQACILYYLFLV